MRHCLPMAAAVALALGAVGLGARLTQAQTSLVMAFVPSGDARRVLESGAALSRMLAVATGYPVRAEVPTSYAATVEAMCAGRVDVAFLAPFAYVLAHQRCGADVRLVSIRAGLPYYRSQILYRAEHAMRSLQDLRGKRFAFVDAVSASGYLFPAALLKKRGIDPDRAFSHVVFAGGHDKVVLAIYSGSVDAGATFGDGVVSDARTRVETQYPDVKEKVRVLAYTDPIPNDTVSFRNAVAEDVKERVAKALAHIAETAPGRETMNRLYQIEGFADFDALKTRYRQSGLTTFDEYFLPVRDAARLLGLNLEELVRSR
ncbi:MAG: phosphate/phosphite/phosphonate ABC transporter substrate-binding protein [Armatimonadota bacterium]|nr:phosphate/phosphite/phosphonate ABC transporter substrate-binding protein [Armatimonadota bacterium]